MSTSAEKLSPERYDAISRVESDAAIRAQNEASYNFEGGEGSMASEWAGMYSTLAEVLRERLPDASENDEDVLEPANPEELHELRAKVMSTIGDLVGDLPVKSTTSSQSMFRRTKEHARTYTSRASHYDVRVADIAQETALLGVPSGKSRKLHVIENDGTAQHQRAQFEPHALVETVFEIDPETVGLTVTQNLSGAVELEHKVIFPSLGLDKASPNRQWSRLAAILDKIRPE